MTVTNSIVNKKYLSVLVDRFFSRYQHEESPNFVEFVRLWFKYAEESYVDESGNTRFSFWKTLSNLENFIDIDEVPNELLKYMMEHYASNFSNILEDIPFFVEWDIDEFGNRHRVVDSFGNIIYRYDNMRLFLRTSRKFFQSKGSYYSYMYLFKLFGGTLEIRVLDKDIIRLSDTKHVLSAPHPQTNRMSHIHGIDPDPYDPSRSVMKVDSRGALVPIRDWWYTFYAYQLVTNLEEEIYKPIILELIHPAGMKCVWKTIENTADAIGWGYDGWGLHPKKTAWGALAPSADPQIEISNLDLTFGSVSVGLDSTYREIEIRNIGEADLIIDVIQLGDDNNYTLTEDGPQAGHTPIGSIKPATIQFGETRTIGVKFNPKLLGDWKTLIVIESNSVTGSVKNINLTGHGV